MKHVCISIGSHGNVACMNIFPTMYIHTKWLFAELYSTTLSCVILYSLCLFQRIRRNISGQRQDALTQAIHINCFDVRRIKLVFILEESEPTSLNQSQKPSPPVSSDQAQGGSPNSSPR